MINTDISQIPPMIKEVDEQDTRRSRKKKKLQVSVVPTRRRSRRKTDGAYFSTRPRASPFGPALEDMDGMYEKEIKVDDADGLDFPSETTGSAEPLVQLRPGHTFYRNPSVASFDFD